MRIISGIYKGRRFYPPAKLTARPTTDFAKEGLFNVLSNFCNMQDATVLDLFAGTGSISFECLSRGAKQVIAVELAHNQQNFIIKQCQELNTDKIRVIRGDVFKYLSEWRQSLDSQPFDFVFADPPYTLALLSSIPEVVFAEPSILAADGVFVLEHSRQYNFSSYPHFAFEREYGNVHFSFFK